MTPERSERTIRRLSRSVEAIHTVGYYSEEINRFTDDGFKGWWHAYFAYRAAPMGPVTAPVVTATFYNFAPRMVERAVPGVWSILSPAQVLERRRELVAEALDRLWGHGEFDPELAEAPTPAPTETPTETLTEMLAEAVPLAEEALVGIEVEARPLAASLAAVDWAAGPPALRLWQACTLWREYRGDGHNLALAAAGVDGLEAHVLMAAHGRGNQPTITGIRGWTAEEWQAAVDRLTARGVLGPDGAYTDEGRVFRSGIEEATDRLAGRPLDTLGPERAGRLADLLDRLAGDLLRRGAVPGVWPPPAVMKVSSS